jgi:hypothetical protein
MTFQTCNTLLKQTEISFAFRRSAQKRLPWGVLMLSKVKFDVIYCVVVVTAAVLVGIVRCNTCGGPKIP